MTQIITLSNLFKTENLNNRFSDFNLFFHYRDDFKNRLFLCPFYSKIYYLTKNIISNVYFTKKS